MRRIILVAALVLLVAHPARADRQRPGIIATLGPTSADVPTLRAMLRAGMDVARINLSHGDARQTRAKVQALRSASRAEGREVPLEFDLPGGKVRTGGGTTVLQPGAAFDLLLGARLPTTPSAAAVDYRALDRHALPGDRVQLADGTLELEVVKVEPGRLVTRVVRGGTLRARTGVALAGKELPFPSMTARDRRKLRLAVDSGASWIGVSMVQGARHVQAVRRALARLGASRVKVVAKIESLSALAKLDEILDASDAVMIARGDLGQAVGAAGLPAAQALIAERARARGKPFIAATNFLSAMIPGGAPSAENLDDIARARAQGPGWFMLNETAIAPAPAEAVRQMKRALDR